MQLGKRAAALRLRPVQIYNFGTVGTAHNLVCYCLESDLFTGTPIVLCIEFLISSLLYLIIFNL